MNAAKSLWRRLCPYIYMDTLFNSGQAKLSSDLFMQAA
jgi:hypothetical protein